MDYSDKVLEPDATVKSSKFGAKKVEVDGIKFDSAAESKFYVDLRDAGLLPCTAMQVPYVLINKGTTWDGQKIRETKYIADFVLPSEDPAHPWVIDIKGFPTKDYLLKEKMMLAAGHRILRFSYSKKAARRFIDAYKVSASLQSAYPRK